LTAKEVVSKLEAEGWRLARQKGSHAVFKHPSRKGRIIVPMHHGDMTKGTLNDILKKGGLKK
jgi:predicted RNA binding protein YcfA (HicA-like mRNA interferase family)